MGVVSARAMSTDERRRVALFATNFLPYSQTFIYEELRHHERYEAEVFAWRRHNAERFQFDRVHLGGPLYPLRGESRVFHRVFAREPFHVVHAHFGPAGVYAARYAQAYNLPLVVTFHGYDVPLLTSPRRFRPDWLPYALGADAMLSRMNLGLCASKELRDMLMAYGVPGEKLRRHPVGVDLRDFAFTAARPEAGRVLMIGRFVEKKGFEYGLRAFARAVSRFPQAKLTVVGEGALEGTLRSLVRELGMESRVHFTGVLSSADIAQELQRTSVLLCPSVVAADGDRESGVVVVKEASASGVVPIGSIHGGIPEIIDDDVTGYLVPERDVDTMALRLLAVLTSEPLRARLALAARAKMEREYDVRALVRGLEGIYDEVCAAFTAP